LSSPNRFTETRSPASGDGSLSPIERQIGAGRGERRKLGGVGGDALGIEAGDEHIASEARGGDAGDGAAEGGGLAGDG